MRTAMKQPAGAPKNFTPYLLLCFTNFFWSLNFIIGKLVVGVIPPVTLSFFRWFFPALFFLAINFRSIKENHSAIKTHIPLLFMLGLTGYALNSILAYSALRYTTTINTSFINAFNPVLIALAGYLMYRNPLSRRQALGFFLSLIGVTIIIFKGQLLSVLQLRINIGDLLMIICISAWAIHTNLYKKKNVCLPANTLFTAMMCSGVLLSLPLTLVENSMTGIEWISRVQPAHIFGIMALSIFPSVLAYRFWNQALVHVSANEVAISQYLIPVFTTLISVSFLGEKLHGFHLVGGGFIFLGVFMVTMMSKNKYKH